MFEDYSVMKHVLRRRKKVVTHALELTLDLKYFNLIVILRSYQRLTENAYESTLYSDKKLKWF